jgi:hypothetical protein
MSISCPSCGADNQAPAPGTQAVCSVCFHIWDAGSASPAGPPAPGGSSGSAATQVAFPAGPGASARPPGLGGDLKQESVGTYRRHVTHLA